MAKGSFEQQCQRLALIEGIARGEQAVENGRLVSNQQAKQKLVRWLKQSECNLRRTRLQR